MPAARIALLMFLLLSFAGCNRVDREQQAKALMSDASRLMVRDTQITKQWAEEFAKVFTVENQAQFPANRDFLRAGAARIIKLLDESSSLNNSAADKYEQAAGLWGNDQERRGMMSFASSFRKTAEINELLKSPLQMVSDEKVVDAKILNQQLLHSWRLIDQKRRESEHDFKEGKRLLLGRTKEAATR